jgi:hypothetical protein
MQAPRRGRGQPAFEPTPGQRQNVVVMRGNGESLRAIAHAIGINVNTLRKHLKVELQTGHDTVRQAMGAALVRAGLAGNVHAIRYWLSCRGGPEWRVVERREIGGLPDGLPIAVSTDAKVVVYLPDNGRGDSKGDSAERLTAKEPPT